MSSFLLPLSLVACVLVLTATAAPCDGTNPDELCLAPLVRKRGGGLGASSKRGTGGGSGGRRGRGARGQSSAVCFPGSAKVRVEGKGIITMDKLSIRDRVQVGDGSYSEVFFFGHKVEGGEFKFVQLVTDHGKIALSHGHYIYVNGRLMAAGSVHVGKMLEMENGTYAAVIARGTAIAQGLYNPHTLNGDIVVDGFRASTYTTALDISIGNALLAPVRAAFRLLNLDISRQCLDNGAPDILLNVLPGGAAEAT